MNREKNLAAFNPILDENGKPKVFYHGTNKEDFSQFKLPGRKGTGGNAIFVSEDPETASYFTHKAPRSRIYPVYVSANNLFDHTNPEHFGKLEQFIRKNFDKLFPRALFGVDSHVNFAANGDYDILEDHDVVKWMKKQGHDGFYVKEGVGRPQNIALFNPSNIKSAISNTGEYDKTNPDITKSEGGEVDDGITAYHGSPHDFDKFDISKIGTGEGAQAYGHGLYFAEAEPVAQGYKKQLAQDFVHVDGKKIPHPSEENPETDHIYRLANHMYQMGHTADEAIEDAMRRAEKLKPNLNSEDFYKAKEAKKAQDWADQISYLKGKHIEWKKDPGHMYEVHINAHPDDFLDWDHDLAHDNNAVVGDILPGVRHYDRVMNKFKKAPTGQEFYHGLAEIAGSDEAATRLLHQAGIKGVKYLDASSRKEGEGSRNYVVFDHDLVTTKRKYAEGGEVPEYPLAEDHKDHLTYMSPDEFLDQTRPLKHTEENKHTIDTFEKGMKQGHKFDPLALYPDNQENGRHRATAAKRLGIKKVPVHNYRKGKKKGGVVDRALMIVSCQPKGSGDAR